MIYQNRFSHVMEEDALYHFNVNMTRTSTNQTVRFHGLDFNGTFVGPLP